MKTSKAKVISKLKNTSEVDEAVMSKKITTSKSDPLEDKIREKAREIYFKRIARGERGNAESDWFEAEKLIRGS